MNNTAIKVENVTKIYKLYEKPSDRLKESLGLSKQKLSRDHYALNDISFEVKRGETVGIIGTNGSGKSTILKIITGVLNPTMGQVQISGRISALLELGAGFNMEYTGIENIYLNGTMIGFSREEIDAKMQDILDFADIGDFVYQPVKTYSSGMFVRLAFAVAINIDPEILIVDEALSVGDVFFQAKCYHKFEEFKEMGKTILFVSHDLGSVAKYCDRVILLNKGHKRAEGDTKEIIDIYKKILVSGSGTDLSEQEDTGAQESKGSDVLPGESLEDGRLWKEQLHLNPGVLDYGERKAEIIDFAVVDEHGLITDSILKGTEFQVKVKVQFHEILPEPIIAFTIKDIRGTEVTGTNTMYEKAYFTIDREEQTATAVFTQKMDLQGGEYLISFGCTGFRNNEFVAYHRLYDACNLTVISDKNTVGFFDMNSNVTVKVK